QFSGLGGLLLLLLNFFQPALQPGKLSAAPLDPRHKIGIDLAIERICGLEQFAGRSFLSQQNIQQVLAVAHVVLGYEISHQRNVGFAVTASLAHRAGTPPVVEQNLWNDDAWEALLDETYPQVPVLISLGHHMFVVATNATHR